jgi:sulfite exporter TauE/SafE
MGKVLGYVLLFIGGLGALSAVIGILQAPHNDVLINNLLVIVIGVALVSLGLKQIQKAKNS